MVVPLLVVVAVIVLAFLALKFLGKLLKLVVVGALLLFLLVYLAMKGVLPVEAVL